MGIGKLILETWLNAQEVIRYWVASPERGVAIPLESLHAKNGSLHFGNVWVQKISIPIPLKVIENSEVGGEVFKAEKF